MFTQPGDCADPQGWGFWGATALLLSAESWQGAAAEGRAFSSPAPGIAGAGCTNSTEASVDVLKAAALLQGSEPTQGTQTLIPHPQRRSLPLADPTTQERARRGAQHRWLPARAFTGSGCREGEGVPAATPRPCPALPGAISAPGAAYQRAQRAQPGESLGGSAAGGAEPPGAAAAAP